jgi:hypothetical protein
MTCSQLVRDAFFIIISDPTIIIALSVRLCTHDLSILYHTTGPTSESDFFTWEALICGPKDTPFVIIPILFSLSISVPFIEIIMFPPPLPPLTAPSLRKAAFLPPN